MKSAFSGRYDTVTEESLGRLVKFHRGRMIPARKTMFGDAATLSGYLTLPLYFTDATGKPFFFELAKHHTKNVLNFIESALFVREQVEKVNKILSDGKLPDGREVSGFYVN